MRIENTKMLAHFDALDKVEYYMAHEKERLEIAENGYRKVKMAHTYKQRVDNILENIM